MFKTENLKVWKESPRNLKRRNQSQNPKTRKRIPRTKVNQGPAPNLHHQRINLRHLANATIHHQAAVHLKKIEIIVINDDGIKFPCWIDGDFPQDKVNTPGYKAIYYFIRNSY